MNLSSKSVILAVSLAAAAIVAACGPATPTSEVPTPGTAMPSGTPSVPEVPPTAPPTSTAQTPPTAPPTSTAQTPPTPPPGPGANQPVAASALLADVLKTGVDMKKIVELEKIPLATKKKIMPFFVKALGYENCSGCHVEGDFKKETRNMKIARGMWNHFVKDLRDQKGGAIFCDSCHGGKHALLDRAHRDSVKKFMESDYVGKFTRADKKDQECGTCHGDAMELKIIEKLWGIPKG